MDFQKKNSSLFIITTLFLVVLYFIFPCFQYYIDPDATSYLTIAKRYAAGDWLQAVNGYWSPFACWLTAFFIRAGYKPFTGAIIVNAIAAVGFLSVSFSFFRKFIAGEWKIFSLTATLAVFLLYAVFKQSFADLWTCFFLLLILRIMIANKFSKKPVWWILTGVLGALAYFSKAYSLPFFILQIVCISFFILRKEEREKPAKWLQINFVAILTMLLCSFPWFWLLHEKYGSWMSSSAGSLNLSWYLVGHPYWKESIEGLLPPAYPGSVYFWEDPAVVNGATPHFWNSFSLFGLQIVRIGYNFLKLFNSMNELSAFFLPATLITFCISISKSIRNKFPKELRIIALSFLLFPLGYLLINFESRYLWYLLPLSMVFLALFLEKIFVVIERKWLRKMIFGIVCISFITWPVWDMKSMYREGADEFKTAQQLKQMSINGSFACNIPYGKESQQVVRLAYFSGNAYYFMPEAISHEKLLQELRRYGVKYFFLFQENEIGENVFTTENEEAFKEVSEGKLEGLKVFQLKD